ncbi:hypothetical protein LDENG_00230510 [Lucifuga dentata]|nr:hypothetical protein LDENG_00230510 [Lucifuga dentata]
MCVTATAHVGTFRDTQIIITFKGPYHPFCKFEPNIFNFYTCNITDNHFPKHTTGTMN